MNDFGGKLRQAREGRGISLRQIAASTKISVAALEALERNDVSKLPGGIFSRAFVRSYAVEVGLDPDETVREFLERFHAEPASAPVAPAQLPPEEIEFERRKQRAARAFVAAIVAMLVLGAIGFYFVLRMRPEVDPGRAITQQSPQPSGPVTQPAPAPAPAAVPGPSVESGRAAGIRLQLHPSGECWVSVVADGRKVFERVLQAGERETLTARDTAVLTVGDGAACTFSLNGRAARPLGASGHVRTARITRDSIDDFVR